LYAGGLNLLSNSKIDAQPKLNNGLISSDRNGMDFDSFLKKSIDKTPKHSFNKAENSIGNRMSKKETVVNKHKKIINDSMFEKSNALKRTEKSEKNVNLGEEKSNKVLKEKGTEGTRETKETKDVVKEDLSTEDVEKVIEEIETLVEDALKETMIQMELPKETMEATVEELAQVIADTVVAEMGSSGESKVDLVVTEEQVMDVLSKVLNDTEMNKVDINTLSEQLQKTFEGVEKLFEDVLGEKLSENQQLDAAIQNAISNSSEEITDKTANVNNEAGVEVKPSNETQLKEADVKVSKNDSNKATVEFSKEGQSTESEDIAIDKDSLNAQKNFDNSKGNEDSDGGKRFEEVKTSSNESKNVVKSDAPTVEDGEKIEVQKFENTLISSANRVKSTGYARLEKSIVDQVTKPIASLNLTDQGSEMLIKLNPKNLGNVELKVSIEKGLVLAEFTVDNQIVKGAIESNLDDLRNALSEKGFSIENLDVSVNQDNRQGEDSSFSHNNNKRNNKKVSFFESDDYDDASQNGLNDSDLHEGRVNILA